jgi:hypothetical protein
MSRIHTLLLAAGLAGCASAPVASGSGSALGSPASSLVICDGKPKAAPAQPKKPAQKADAKKKQRAEAAPQAAAPAAQPAAPATGRLEVKLLAPAAGEQPKDGEQAKDVGRRLSVVAEGVPLRELAPRLSEATGANVVLDPAVAGRRLWLWMPDVSVRGLQRALLDEYGIASTMTKGVLLLQPEAKAKRVAPAPLETRVVELPAASEPAQVARLWCRMFATRRGSAAVLDRTIVFEDTAEGLSFADALAARFGGTAQPLMTPAPAPAPEPKPAPSQPEASR